jgi:hypothetical protein
MDDTYFEAAPGLARPLSPWNPFDYARLLFWCLFFPQALQAYVELFVRRDFDRAMSLAERARLAGADALLKNLLLQALLLEAALFLAIGGGLRLSGLHFTWSGVAVGIFFGLIRGILKTSRGAAKGVSFGIAVGAAAGLAGGIVFSIEISVAGALAIGFALGGAFGVAEGIATGVRGGVAEGLAFGAAVGLSLGIASGLTAGFVAVDLFIGLVGGFTFGAAVLLSILRPLEWLSGALVFRLGLPPFCRVTPLPFPGIRRRLGRQLGENWEEGLGEADRLLRFSLQFLPVIGAVNDQLRRSAPDELLPRVALLAERITDKRLLRYGSASILRALGKAALEGLLILPARREHPGAGDAGGDLRLDTPARCACAGFWHLHGLRPEAAAQAFAGLRELPHGGELEALCRTLAEAQKISQIGDLAEWSAQPHPESKPEEALFRRVAGNAVRELRRAAEEVSAALHAAAAANRSAAIGRAAASLQKITQATDLPIAEGRILRRIAKKWLPLVIELGGQAGEEVIRQPIDNPYVGYSGRPVEGATFVGRRDVLRRLERLWTGQNPWTAVFLYGHRRMGKTSVLRNLQKALKPGTLVVQLDMQGAAYVDHTGQLLFEFARAIFRRAGEAKLDCGEPPELAAFGSLGHGRILLDALFERLEPQMADRILVLAIDEFEVVQERIEKGKIDPDFLTYLRSANQRFRFLALIFSGLHKLDEMGIHYRQAFYGQAEHVRVEYLNKDDAMRLITQPAEGFSLEYTPELREELYRRTFGQPYLLQRLCWELVDAWNDRFLELGEKTPRTLELADLDRLDSEAFFQSAHYYFDGVWSNRTAAEQAFLRRLAASGGPLARTDVAAAGEAAIVESLARHDVVIEREGRVDFAAELLRRWVATQQLPAAA